MDNLHDSESYEWTGRFVRALDAVRATVDRRQFLDDLTNASVEIAGADRVHAILMEGSTVVAEASCRAGGESFDVPEDRRKAAARSALAATKLSADSGNTTIETSDRSLVVSFIVKEGVAGVVRLEREQGFSPESREASLATALIFSAARSLHAEEALAAATDRAVAAEARIREIEMAAASGGVGAVAYLKPVAELERDAIELALRTTKWNKEMAARRLGISRASIYMKVKKFNLQKPV